MEPFEVSTINLSMVSPETGNLMTANVYHVDGIARDLSIGQLVMALCLARATELEATIIGQMEEMSRVTVNLQTLTDIQTQITISMNQGKSLWSEIADTNLPDNASIDIIWYKDVSAGTKLEDCGTATHYSQVYKFLTTETKNGGPGVEIKNEMKLSEVVTNISTAMDSLNTTNQQQMIELQSLTNKRDQSYELITNMLKSIGTVLTGTASNFMR